MLTREPVLQSTDGRNRTHKSHAKKYKQIGRENAPRLQRVWINGRHNFNVGDGQDADHGVPLALVPIVVHLTTDVDQIAFLKAQLAMVLRLERIHNKLDRLVKQHATYHVIQKIS